MHLFNDYMRLQACNTIVCLCLGLYVKSTKLKTRKYWKSGTHQKYYHSKIPYSPIYSITGWKWLPLQPILMRNLWCEICENKFFPFENWKINIFSYFNYFNDSRAAFHTFHGSRRVLSCCFVASYFFSFLVAFCRRWITFDECSDINNINEFYAVRLLKTGNHTNKELD